MRIFYIITFLSAQIFATNLLASQPQIKLKQTNLSLALDFVGVSLEVAKKKLSAKLDTTRCKENIAAMCKQKYGVACACYNTFDQQDIKDPDVVSNETIFLVSKGKIIEVSKTYDNNIDKTKLSDFSGNTPPTEIYREDTDGNNLRAEENGRYHYFLRWKNADKEIVVVAWCKEEIRDSKLQPITKLRDCWTYQIVASQLRNVNLFDGFKPSAIPY